ncbi:MAG: glutamate--tRNA ligase [Alphaproteobacteria bacterium]|nr:glutamate--tRNA ligase [Alphaproteobacteria bacterium]
MNKIRSRFAPSPTGYMHIGNLRTALYEYLIAKSQKGEFVLRIEDTDQERYIEGAVDIIYKTMKDVGFVHDEGPDVGGAYGPYIQSERKSIYKSYADQLVDLGGAHYCFCSAEEIEKQRQYAEQNGKPFKFIDPCKSISVDEARERIKNGEKYTVRQTIDPVGKTTFIDEVYGKITVDNSALDEGILLKSDGLPTYNFANVIDDHEMKISHVVRGNEYLSSTPKYNLIYEAYGWDIPTYVHLPPIMKDEHNKLSKRNGDASFQDLVQKGYLPEAIINYIALLGWSPKTEQEIFSMDELIEKFSIKGINKSAPIFDIEKLKWMNGVYIRRLSLEDFHEKTLPYYQQTIKREIDLKELSKILQSRINTFSEISELIDFIESLPDYSLDLFIHKKMKTDLSISLKVLEEALTVFDNPDCFGSREKLHNELIAMLAKMGMKNGQVFWPIRVALTGKQFTPGGATEVAFLLGQKESIKRINIAVNKIKNAQ